MSDGYKVVYSPAAFDNIRKIYSYIASELQAPDTVQNQVNRIRQEIRSLDSMPTRHSLIEWEPWRRMQTHKLSVDNYVVYYTVEEESHTVTIVRVSYGGQDTQNMI